MTASFNSLSGKSFISVSIGIFLVVSFGTYSSVSLFCFTFGFCFYELGKTATSDLEKMALCGNIPCVDGLCLMALASQLKLEQTLESAVPEAELVGELGLE